MQSVALGNNPAGLWRPCSERRPHVVGGLAVPSRGMQRLPRFLGAPHTPCQQQLWQRQQQQQQQCVCAHALSATPGGEVEPIKDMSSLWRLARIHNMIPSILLCFVGAWAGAGHSLSVLVDHSVWLISLLSGGVAVASVVVNDYFDFKVDAANAPHKPLPSGAVAPDIALLLSSVIYCSVLIVACLLEPSMLRNIIAFSAAATLLYTPVFKKLTAVKNATVATVIALAPVAGALAAGAGEAGMRALLPASTFAFSGVMFREILMDLNDTEGDRAARVITLPVALGKPAALAAATACILAGAAGAAVQQVSLLAHRPSSLLGVLTGPLGVDPGTAAQLAQAAPLVALAWALGCVLSLGWRVAASGFDKDVVGYAVDELLKPVGLGMILLAALT